MNTSRSTQTTTPSRSISAFTDVPDTQWNDWDWQWNNRITSLDGLSGILTLTDQERGYWSGKTASRLPVAVTPYYAELLASSDPLRRCIVPDASEHVRAEGELADPLAEERHSPLPGVVHRYPDRVLFLVETECPTYCRYCTRGRMVGRGRSLRPDSDALKDAIDYVRSHPDVHDVLISGGEPLLWDDHQLASLLRQLATIDHLDYVRIGTKAPMTWPQRITPDLCEVLADAELPVYFSVHATHADELTADSIQALRRLVDAGCALSSQTVLLHGVNDSVDTLTDLFRGLLRHRVKPYYLLLCDPVVGSSRFWVSVDDATNMMNALRMQLSGYGIPHLIMDLPDGGGKIPIAKSYRVGEDETFYHYLDSAGTRTFRYPKLPSSS